jgi:superfamily II RNA helicase
VRDKFIENLGFIPDSFQLEAFKYIEKETNLLVAAPTGAGKTLVGEYAIWCAVNDALEGERNKVFYTTPIKALSNQKYHDLLKEYGYDKVGLITGDTVINSEAQVVVMTTEVLRNMLYDNSTTLIGLKSVVMDEVHYLGDKSRGSVWEEVLIHINKDVNIIALSATVSNLEEFSGWLEEVRGNCEVVVSEKRPIELKQYIMLGNGKTGNGKTGNEKSENLLSLYEDDGKTINPILFKRMRTELKFNPRGYKRNYHKGKPGRSRPNLNKKAERVLPRRVDTIKELKKKDMLPCIFFIFSRKGCDEALSGVMKFGEQLTTSDEAWEIANFLRSEVESKLENRELITLGYADFLSAAMDGYAAHHAGVLQIFREATEKLFEKGLLKCVFATETLALGVNMPARTVVIERLTKFNGVGHEKLTPGEFTQFTGRAGRRGKDTVGYSVVLDQKELQPTDVANLVSNRVYPLISSFQPNYNMVANLLKKVSEEQAKVILKKSYAQYQLDQKSKELQERIDDYSGALAGYQKHFEDSNQNSAKRWKNRYNKTMAKKGRIENQLEQNNLQLVNEFTKIKALLVKYDYLNQNKSKEIKLTQKGHILTHINCEHEILLIESVLEGIFENLKPAEMAAVLSCFISVSKATSLTDSYIPGIPQEVFQKLFKLESTWKKIHILEKRLDIKSPRAEFELNFSLVQPVFDYANGASLETILDCFNPNQFGRFGKQKRKRNYTRGGRPLGLGDFIRCTKGVIDLSGQIYRNFDNQPQIAKTADQVIYSLKHGLIALLLDEA